ncbi:polymeric immunoglobulin receptor-like isoform X2 [Leucoraja erinacea]|uniref:polymeric immunoglobulin receptor-like isoform X2 n=1 Tax=Leucoraja erinaceus TaxID=7782 RepID=UPI0024573502|nr:polymeric immunoglobulin receptor-like isoform X2 [Leucoraja erinacea]
MKYIHFTLFLTTFSLAAALTGPKLVSGTLGGAVTIRCQYHAYYKYHEKYWCKGSDWKSCSVLANSASQHKNIDDRIRMVDNQTAGEFITKVTQLSANDTGLYWCGIVQLGYDRMVPVRLNVTEAALTGPKLVSGTLGGAVTIRCQYHAYYKYHEKYLCKGSDWKSCSVLANSTNQHKNIDDRIRMVDNQTAGEFITKVTQLSANDTGLYWCGIVQFGYDRMVPVRLNVTEAALTGPKLVSGTLGGAVTIRCQYHAYYKYHEKYLCKGSDWKSCSVLANSANQHKNIDDRIRMVDNQTAGEFITKVTQLSANDTGLYWCGIVQFGYDRMVPVRLNVTEAALTGPKLVSGTLGGAVTIRCQYHASYKYHEKYWCKGSDWKSCSVLANSTNQHKNIDDRIRMVDNQTAGEFITKVTQLSANDSGLYWCGIVQFGYDRMVPVRLNVTEDPTTQPPTISPELQETAHHGNQREERNRSQRRRI